jgi:hypothetical protein
MKHVTSRELYDYWNRVRRGRPAPRRNEIEPGDIRRILADTFILEVTGRDRFPIRLAGTRMCGMYGREIKGGNFLDLWTVNDRNAIATRRATAAPPLRPRSSHFPCRIAEGAATSPSMTAESADNGKHVVITGLQLINRKTGSL